jgi:hypothetical protein
MVVVTLYLIHGWLSTALWRLNRVQQNSYKTPASRGDHLWDVTRERRRAWLTVQWVTRAISLEFIWADIVMGSGMCRRFPIMTIQSYDDVEPEACWWIAKNRIWSIDMKTAAKLVCKCPDAGWRSSSRLAKFQLQRPSTIFILFHRKFCGVSFQYFQVPNHASGL